MNVLHLISGRGPTGPAAATLGDARALLAAGTNTFVASRDDGYMPTACRNESIPYIGGMKLGRGARRFLTFRHDCKRLHEIVRELSIDVVHTHRNDDHILAAIACRALPVIAVRTWHSDPRALPGPVLKKLCAQLDGNLCVSREYAQTLESCGSAAAFIHSAVDTAVYSPQERLPGPFLLAHVGRWKLERDGQDRGQRAALSVFSKLPRDESWVGVLAGRGEQEAALRREAYEVHHFSRERVKFVELTELSLQEYAKLLASFSLGLVFACGADGSSRPAGELLASGVPLAVADRPGLREMAEDPRCALHLLHNDATGWAAAIQKLLKDPQRLAAMAEAARQRAEAVHALKVRGLAMREFYAGLK